MGHKTFFVKRKKNFRNLPTFTGYGGKVVDNSFCSSSPASALIVQNCVNKDNDKCERDGGWSEWRPWPTPDPNKLVFFNTGRNSLSNATFGSRKKLQ